MLLFIVITDATYNEKFLASIKIFGFRPLKFNKKIIRNSIQGGLHRTSLMTQKVMILSHDFGSIPKAPPYYLKT